MNNAIYAAAIPVGTALTQLIKQFIGDSVFANNAGRRAAFFQILAVLIAVLACAVMYYASVNVTSRTGLLDALGFGLVAGLGSVGLYHFVGGSSAALTSAVGTLATPTPPIPLAMTLTADTSQAEAAIGSLSNQVSDLHDGIDALHTKLDALPTKLPPAATPTPQPAPVQAVVTPSAAAPEPTPVAHVIETTTMGGLAARAEAS